MLFARFQRTFDGRLARPSTTSSWVTRWRCRCRGRCQRSGPAPPELRIRDAAGIYRAFYLVKVADAVLVFHAFAKKTQKTPDREIELGKKRLKEML